MIDEILTEYAMLQVQATEIEKRKGKLLDQIAAHNPMFLINKAANESVDIGDSINAKITWVPSYIVDTTKIMAIAENPTELNKYGEYGRLSLKRTVSGVPKPDFTL